MFKRKCKITFINHGSTVYTAENRFYDVSHYPPLDENGKEEIHNLTNWLKKRSLKNDCIYSAPMLRSVQTAEIISKKYSQDFEILESLTSKDEGDWGAMSFDEIEEKTPGFLAQYHENPIDFGHGNGEDILEYMNKVTETIEDIVEKNIRKRVILVADSSFIRAAIMSSLGIAPQNYFRVYISTGSATQINFYKHWASLVYSGYVPA